MPHVADRLPAFNRVIESPIQNGRGHLLLQLAGHVSNGFQQTVQLEPIFGRSEDNRSVIQEEQSFLNPLTELRQGRQPLLAIVAIPVLPRANLDFLLAGLSNILGHEVPFVDHHDAGASLLDNHISNLLVLLSDPVQRIDHQNGDVTASDGTLGPFNGKVLDAVIDATCLPDTRGVHQHVLFTPGLGHHLERNVNGIAGRPRDLTDDNSIRSGNPVDDGRLADIRTANDGQTLRTLWPSRRQGFALFSFFKQSVSPFRIALTGSNRF